MKFEHEFSLGGKIKTGKVELNGVPFDHRKSLKIMNHSPTGFSWGYLGSGPHQLGLALLMEITEDIELSKMVYRDFVRKIISKIHGSDFKAIVLISGDEKPKNFTCDAMIEYYDGSFQYITNDGKDLDFKEGEDGQIPFEINKK